MEFDSIFTKNNLFYYLCIMINRELSLHLKRMAAKMPVLSITGPRQSGKTTLARMTFPEYDYVNLENPDTLESAVSDPRYFLQQFEKGVIIDEVQRYPELFSYIQTISDMKNRPGQFVLIGSQNFLLSEKVSQSLAGRVFITHLLPLSIGELQQTSNMSDNPDAYIFKGFYPRIHHMDIEPEFFYPSYIQSYLERDVRQIVNVSNLYLFQQFLRLAAGRVGQLLNYNSISNELGIDLKTVKSWFSILESSFIVFFLQPHFQNYNKRILKTAKLYFYDTGLVCNMLGIKKMEDIATHWAKGALFENMMIADLKKNFFNRSEMPPLYYWRDSTGNEVNCLIDAGINIKSVEIKSSSTVTSLFFKGLDYYARLNPEAHSFLLYGGNKNELRKKGRIISWKNTLAISNE